MCLCVRVLILPKANVGRPTSQYIKLSVNYFKILVYYVLKKIVINP